MRKFLFLSLVILASLAQARVNFSFQDFGAGEFRNFNRTVDACNAPAAGSFWCANLEAELTLITTKGFDIFFNEAGEVVALFAKQQRGQQFNRQYTLDNNQNLIPAGATVPGGALLLDGIYAVPSDATATWVVDPDGFVRGDFAFVTADFEVTKTVVVSDYQNTFNVSLRMTPLAGTPAAEAGAVNVQYSYPGLARQENPFIKIGQGNTFSLNPVSQAVDNPLYISLQNNNNNTGFALIMTPSPTSSGLQAISLPPRNIAMMQTLTPDAPFEMAMRVYAGPNELVRYYQEGYLDLPGLFRPNILGRMSLGVLVVLEAIYGVVRVWGLAIILLTLLFRLLVWPLITTQTRSMMGMQQLQPKLQALQKKHKDDREKLTAETMKLYQEAGVNPAGGCLPMFIQMPIFIILWRVFVNYEFNEGFLWVPDLGLPDPFYILPVLYLGVMLGQSYFMAKGNPQSMKQQMLINVVFIFFIITFPAGVTLYWVVSMLIQILQYYIIQRSMPAPVAATGIKSSVK